MATATLQQRAQCAESTVFRQRLLAAILYYAGTKMEDSATKTAEEEKALLTLYSRLASYELASQTSFIANAAWSAASAVGAKYTSVPDVIPDDYNYSAIIPDAVLAAWAAKNWLNVVSVINTTFP